jgi:hypothetical protein
MPQYQAMIERANEAFNRKNFGGLDADAFAAGKNLPDALRALGIAANAQEEAYLDSIAPAVTEAIRGALDVARNHRDGALPVQFVWMPYQGQRVTITSVAGTATSIGGISIILETPIPA